MHTEGVHRAIRTGTVLEQFIYDHPNFHLILLFLFPFFWGGGWGDKSVFGTIFSNQSLTIQKGKQNEMMIHTTLLRKWGFKVVDITCTIAHKIYPNLFVLQTI